MFAACSRICAFASALNADVAEVNVGIKPTDYNKMVSSEAEKRYSVYVSVNNNDYFGAGLHIRGRTSKMIGMAMPSKRVPVTLNFSLSDQSPSVINNTAVRLINSYTPYRLVAEYIALELFDFMGIAVPDHGFVFLSYNGVDDGLYLAVEDVNQIFINKHFSYKSGSLYKEVEKSTPYNSFWFGPYSPKINRGTSGFRKLLKALDSRSGYEERIDMDQFLRFFAVTAALGADVSILTELSGFLLYDNNGKFVLIPWDNSEAFQGYDTINGIDKFYLNGNSEMPCPLFELIMSDPQNREKYHSYIRQINDEFLAPEVMHPYLTGILEAIAPYLGRDVSIYLNNDRIVEDLLDENSSVFYCLKHTLDCIHDSLEEQLEGKSSVFYYHEEYLSDDMPSTIEEINDMFMAQSPMLDTSLPEKICDAYTQWKSSLSGEKTVRTPGTELAVFFLIIFAGAAITLLVIILPRKKGMKQTGAGKLKNEKNDDQPEGGSV